MNPILRRIALGFGALFLLALGSVVALQLYGESRLNEMARRFTREVGPIPDLDASLDQRRQQDEDQSKVLAMMREARAAGDAALLALRTGNRGHALARLRELIVARDEILARPNLPAQIVGVSLGQKVLEVGDAYVRSGGMSAEAQRTLADALEYSWSGWGQTLAHEAALSLYWSREVGTDAEAEVGRVERMLARLRQPYSAAAALGLYLGMYEAVRDQPTDVAAYLERARAKAGGLPGMDQTAKILIPNLVLMTERHRDYLQQMESLRTRLMTVAATSRSV